MKVLFVVDSISYGGAGRVVTILANRLIKLGYQVRIVVMGNILDETKGGYLLDSNVKASYYYYECKDNRKWLSQLSYIRKKIKIEHPNVCIAFLNIYAEYTVVASFFTDTKVLVCERNDPKSSPQGKIYRLLRNPLYRLSDAVICQTNDMKHFFPKTIQKKAKVIPNPVNDRISDVKIEKRAKRIVMVGKLSKQKNYSLAISAFNEVKDIIKEYTLEIYGEGLERGVIENLIRTYNLENRVLLMGHSDDVLNKIKDASLFIMTSDYEGMSNALMEAMALGIPCISTNHPIGGANELIENGINGFLIPVGGKKELEKQMIKVLNDKQLADKLSYEAKKIRTKYNVDRVVSRWIEVIADYE